MFTAATNRTFYARNMGVRRPVTMLAAGVAALVVALAGCTDSGDGGAAAPMSATTAEGSTSATSARTETVAGTWHLTRQDAAVAHIVVAVGGCDTFERAEVDATTGALTAWVRRVVTGDGAGCTGELVARPVDVALPAGFDRPVTGSCTPDQATADGRTCGVLATAPRAPGA